VTQVVDPAVSRAKFDAEIERFEAHRFSYTKRGWWLVRAEFPIAEIAFLSTKLRPPVVALTARFDFTDFDLKPLSVKFIDTFNGNELPAEQLQSRMKRLDPAFPPEMATAMMAQGQQPRHQDLIQAYPGEPGFLCMPGVREYHEHPAHSGDAWELHRATGEGSMLQIAEKIWQYGSDPIDRVGIELRQTYQQSQLPA
jgi:hypothetical protein